MFLSLSCAGLKRMLRKLENDFLWGPRRVRSSTCSVNCSRSRTFRLCSVVPIILGTSIYCSIINLNPKWLDSSFGS